MLSHRLIKLIETHAESLTHEAVQDVQTNEHTRSHARIPKEELSPRVLSLYRNLGNWIGDPKDDAISATSMRNGAEFAANKEFRRVKSSSA
jgi:hypothetical protein